MLTLRRGLLDGSISPTLLGAWNSQRSNSLKFSEFETGLRKGICLILLLIGLVIIEIGLKDPRETKNTIFLMTVVFVVGIVIVYWLFYILGNEIDFLSDCKKLKKHIDKPGNLGLETLRELASQQLKVRAQLVKTWDGKEYKAQHDDEMGRFKSAFDLFKRFGLAAESYKVYFGDYEPRETLTPVTATAHSS